MPPLSTSRHRLMKLSPPAQSHANEEANRKNGGSVSATVTAVQSREDDEERRKALREIELKVMKYQDELESKNAPNQNEEISRFRQSLLEKAEAKLAKRAEKVAAKASNNGSGLVTKKTSSSSRRSRSRSPRDLKKDSRGGKKDRDSSPQGFVLSLN
jgi:hypothetical protein